MKVIVVGKGRLDDPLTCSGHTLFFSNTPEHSDSASIPKLANYDLALFHLSEDSQNNREFAGVLDAWKGEGMSHKVIAISGGGFKDSHAERLKGLGSLPFIGGVVDREAVLRLRWKVIPLECDWPAPRIARTLQEPDAVFPALFILGQALLSVSVRLAVDGKDVEIAEMDESGAMQIEWKRVEEAGRKTIEDANRALGIPLRNESVGNPATSFSQIEFWKRFLPQLESQTPLEQWIQDQFGALECQKTQKLLAIIKSERLPDVVQLAAAIPELKAFLND